MKIHNFTIYLNVTAYQMTSKKERARGEQCRSSERRNNYRFAIAVVEVVTVRYDCTIGRTDDTSVRALIAFPL